MTRVRGRGEPLLDLTGSNPTQVGFAYPRAGLAEALASTASVAYDPVPGGLRVARESVAADYRRRGATVDPDAIVLTSSTSEAYSWLFRLLCDPGDSVLVAEPGYPLFDLLTGLDAVSLHTYTLELDGRWRLDVGALARATADARVRAVILVAPGNPTGAVPDPEEWDTLQEYCAARGLALIVDEVFADYAATGPLTAASRPVSALTFTLGGLSKSGGLPQLKVAWIGVHGPATRTRPALSALQTIADTYLPVATPIQRALPELMDLGATVRRQIQARVGDNRDRLAARLGPESPVSLLPGPGCWSAILRLPAIRTDEAWALRLLDLDHLLVHPGYFFELGHATCLVTSMLAEPDVVGEGARRLLDRVVADTPG